MAEVIQPRERPTLVQHLRRLAPVQIKLLGGAFVLGLIGLAVYTMAEFGRPPASTSTHDAASRDAATHVTAPSSGFVNDSATGSAAPPTEAVAPADTWTGWGGAKTAKLGFGFVGGFVIGFIFRAFLKMMTLVTLVIGGGLAALSYFHILNIDLTAAHKVYADNSQWLTDQAWRLKDVLATHLPSSTTGAAGIFFGSRRR